MLKEGESSPSVIFAGHVDVVPPGPIDKWHSDPFIPTEKDGLLYGRGSADMKSSIAAFIVAINEFTAEFPNHKGSIGLFITSDEEGIATDGTKKIVEHFIHNNQDIDYCIVRANQCRKFGDN